MKKILKNARKHRSNIKEMEKRVVGNTQEVALARGGSPVPVGVNSSISGKVTGRSLSGTALISPFSSNSNGKGSPQYRCLANSQSRSL